MMDRFEAPNLPEAHYASGLLASAGIPNEVRGGDLWLTLGAGGSVPGLRPTVWLHDPADRERALRILDGQASPQGAPTEVDAPWVCPGCGEVLEPQFDSCWQCGFRRWTP